MYNPADITALWEHIIVPSENGPVASPGVVTVTGQKLEWGWDVKDAEGQDGASVTRKGMPLAKGIKLSFNLSDDPNFASDFFLWDEFEEILRAAMDSDPPTALQMYHPDLQRLGLFEFLIVSIGELTLDGTGGGTIVVEVMKYAPPKVKSSGTGGATGSGASSPKAESEADKRIKQAQDELDQALAEGADL